MISAVLLLRRGDGSTTLSLMDSARPIIRQAVLKDAVGIFELIKTHPDPLISRSVPSIVENIDRFVVAERQGRVAGCASWCILPEIGEPERTLVEVQSVAVAAELRRQGVGTALVEAVLARARAIGTAQVIALTFAPAFFARFGFREISKQQIMHKIYMGCKNCTKHANPFTCPEIAMALTLTAGSATPSS